MECGEQCVIMAMITMLPELCADNWDTMWTQMKVSLFIHLESDVAGSQIYVCGEVLLWLKMYLHVRETVFDNEMKEPMTVTTQPYM